MSERSAHLADAVDLEMNCLICGTRLYVPETALSALFTSLNRGGTVILVCPGCGQAQTVRRKIPQSGRYNN